LPARFAAEQRLERRRRQRCDSVHLVDHVAFVHVDDRPRERGSTIRPVPAMISVLNRPHELKIHVKAARLFASPL
jgi:hypothetical protein